MNKRYGISIALSVALAAGALGGCAATSQASADDSMSPVASAIASAESESSTADSAATDSKTAAESNAADSASSEAAGSSDSAGSSSAAQSGKSRGMGGGGQNTSSVTTSADAADVSSLPDMSDQFSDRDLEQSADTSSAKQLTLSDGQDVSITEEGVYVVSGTASNATITVNADDAAKVQIVLDGVNITNETKPAIYVASADKVFVTTAQGSENSLSVSGELAQIDGEDVTGVIFSKDDITLNGQGTLAIKSTTANGIVGKDDVKVTGGTYKIEAGNHAIKANDSVSIAGGTFDLKATKDAIHADNSDDPTLGYVYVKDGTFTIEAGSDGIEGDAFVIVDGGTINMKVAEGIEGTIVQINDGTISIEASDDGINAPIKSSAYVPAIQINGGKLTVNMGSGDTDALDSNGGLYITGGTVDITAQFAFDFDTEGKLTGGTVTVNGEEVTEITESMQMGGRGGQGGMGGMGGQRPDMGGQGADGQQGEMGGHRGHGGHGPRGDMGNGGQQGDATADGSGAASTDSQTTQA